MASSRVPLFKIDFITKIFETYTGTLTSQFLPKKIISSWIDSASSTFTSWFSSGPAKVNPYAENAELTKIEAMEAFTIKITRALELDNPTLRLIEILEELNSHWELSRVTEKKNLSKYRIALRAVISYIIKHISPTKEFQSHINTLQDDLETVESKLGGGKNGGYNPNIDTTSITIRNNLVLRLANLGNINAIQFATEHDLFSAKDNIQPGSAFCPLTQFDPKFSAPCEIIYNIPWTMQPNLWRIFDYRIKNHEFPRTKETIRAIFAKDSEESKPAPSKESTPALPIPDPAPAKRGTSLSSSTIPNSAPAENNDNLSAKSESKEVKNPPSSSANILAGLPPTTTKSNAPSEQPKAPASSKAPKHESKNPKRNKHRGATVEQSESPSPSPSSSSLTPS